MKIMRRLYLSFSILGIVTLTSCSFFGSGYDAKYEDENLIANFYKLDQDENTPVNEHGYELVNVKFKALGIQEINLPKKVKNKNITKIDSAVFGNDLRRLEKLKIPFIGVYKTKMNTSYCGSILSIFDNFKELRAVDVNTTYITDGFDERVYYTNSLSYIYHTYYYLPSALQTIILTNEKFVSSRAFANCSNVNAIGLNKQIIAIGDYAFENCSNLTEIYFEGSKSEWDEIQISSIGNDSLLNATIEYNCNLELI